MLGNQGGIAQMRGAVKGGQRRGNSKGKSPGWWLILPDDLGESHGLHFNMRNSCSGEF